MLKKSVLKIFPVYPFLVVSANKPDAKQNDWSAWGEELYLAYEDIAFIATSEQADLTEDLTVTVVVQKPFSETEQLSYLGLSDSNKMIFEGAISVPNHVVAIWNESPSDAFIDVASDSVKVSVYHNNVSPNSILVVLTELPIHPRQSVA